MLTPTKHSHPDRTVLNGVSDAVKRQYWNNPASGGVKIVEIGRFENRCIRGRILVRRRCASPWLQKKNGERRYFDGSRVKKMAVLGRFSNRLIYTILKSPLARAGLGALQR
jgi:hypothetical protein